MSDSDIIVDKSVNARKRSYPPVQEGEKVVVPWETEDYKMACCDCGLVHRLRFTVEGSDIIMQGWRDNRASAQLRRRREYGGKAHVLNPSTNNVDMQRNSSPTRRSILENTEPMDTMKNETEIWKSRALAHEENYYQLLKRVDELVAENKLWQEEAKRWRDMYMEFDEMLEERVNEAVQRLEKVWEGLDELKKKVEDEY